ncbi:elongation factor P--(R)-beta-lysine ligase [Enterobacteriaceae endosymbiont of Neohaemonia nigricornis]|nr:elongation factor P--(R)-beta-lysine ligase [Enterobacteriaceae endosymbiont of Neohaemonia nigricornis]
MMNMKWKPNISNKNIIKRAYFIKQIRNFFDNRNFIEVETPILSQSGNTNVYLHQLTTKLVYNSKHSKKLYLVTSPEYHMKRILAAKIKKPIYQICHSFRNGEYGQYHNPEFTMLEWYCPNFNLYNLIDMVQQFFLFLRFPVFKKISYKNIFLSTLNINPFNTNHNILFNIFKKLKLIHLYNKNENIYIMIQILFDLYIIPKLGFHYPVLIYNFPAYQKTTEMINNNIAIRFELFYKGVELGNGFQELTSSDEQYKRFEEDNKKRCLMKLPQKKIDYYLLKAMKSGMPNCSGMAIGLDRLIMFLCKTKSIHDIISFSIKQS